MIILAVGPDHFLLERHIRQAALAADPDRLNTTRFDRTRSLAEVIGAVSTMGFFGTGRVVIADGILARASGNGKAKQVEEVAELLGSVAPGNTLILADETVQSIPAAVRKLANATPFDTFTGAAPRGQELVAWVQDEVNREGGTIEHKAVIALLDILYPGTWQAADKSPQYDQPPDLQNLISEIGKLVTAAGGSDITSGYVRALVHRETQDQLFPLVEAIMGGKVSGAMKMLGEIGADDETAARTMSQIAVTAEISQIAAGMRDSDAKALASQLGQTEKRLLGTRSRTTPARAAELADTMIASDRRLKRGKTRSPVTQMQDFLITEARKTRDR